MSLSKEEKMIKRRVINPVYIVCKLNLIVEAMNFIFKKLIKSPLF